MCEMAYYAFLSRTAYVNKLWMDFNSVGVK